MGLRRAASHSFAIALLPLSMVPFAIVVPHIINPKPHGRGVRLHGGSAPVPPPTDVSLTSAESARFQPPPPYNNAIPVLLFHGINNNHDHYSISRYSFARDLALLQHLGYHTISIYQYAAWRRGEKVDLPSRPVLLTFDDGRFDSWRGADRILAKYHMKATMYVITGPVVRHNLFYLKWPEIQQMQRSGRWDIQFHANNGHVYVLANKDGQIGPYYAVLEYNQQTKQEETLAHYQVRVAGDISTGLALMAAHGYVSPTMAMPYGEYGQSAPASNGVKKILAKILTANFAAAFVQSVHLYTPYSTPRGEAVRYELQTGSTLDELYGFLYGSDPAAGGTTLGCSPASSCSSALRTLQSIGEHPVQS